ncbi:MAG TPA: branched-chain amino acid ABC transporter substrate-binding protein [Burkholderiales bacterium]
MRRTWLLRLAAAAMLAADLGGASAADAIKLAVLGPMSGPFALLGEERFKVFQMSADIVNARGGVLGGRKIEVIAFDNKSNPQESLIVLRQAIDQDIHFIASSASNVAHAISDALVKHNARNPGQRVLFFDFNALDPVLTEAKCNFWHFRFEVHSDTQVDVLTDYMKKQPALRKVYLLNQDYAFGQAVSKAAKDMLAAKRPDIQIVGDDFVPLGKVKDFAPYVAKIRASGADSVLTGNWGNDLSLLIKAANEAGLKAVFYAMLGGYPGTWGGIGGAGADRVKSLDAWHLNAADGAWQKTLLDYRSKYAMVSNGAYLPPLRVVDMFASALAKAGSADPVKVAYALEGLQYAGPSGPSWMRAEDHQMIAPLYILSLVKAGQPGVRFDEEKTGYGWKTEAFIEAADTIPALKCRMERPPG